MGDDIVVERGEAVFAIHQHDHHIRVLNGHEYLLADGIGKAIVDLARKTARVDDGKGDALPFGFPVVSITGNARQIVHQGIATASQTVEECGLAHIGPPHQGYNGVSSSA